MELDPVSIAEKIYTKALCSVRRNGDRIPYSAEDGVFDDKTDTDICWWTNGFWAGMLWQLWGYRDDPLLRDAAVSIERKLDKNLMLASGMDHDSGFKWLLTSGANYRLTGDPDSRNRLLLAATNLAGRFNPAGQYIRAWNDSGDGSKAGLAIIDCLMNLPLLYWAADELSDIRFRAVATAHAKTALRCFLRPNGSVNHIVVFDPGTGRVLDAPGGQGMAPGSSWTRGQSWAIYGFTLSFIHTGDAEFLSGARRVADYFISNLPASGLVPVDFDQPPELDWEDGSAAACAACGLLELERLTGEARYRHIALELLLALTENRCDLRSDRDGILTHCTAAYRDSRHNYNIIYGDYFLTEAILKLCGKGTFLW